MSRDFLHPDLEIDKHGIKLPHWQQDEVMQFITFRLADSLPREKVQHWKSQRAAWKSTHPQPWTTEESISFHKRFTQQFEHWLDQGMGSCLFRESENRKVLADTLMHFQNTRVEHHAWVIMPNHVHVLCKPKHPIDLLVKAWKGVSARNIYQGSIWQQNYRDTLIRDSQHFANVVRYIRNNPTKANLQEHEFTLWESERASTIH